MVRSGQLTQLVGDFMSRHGNRTQRFRTTVFRCGSEASEIAFCLVKSPGNVEQLGTVRIWQLVSVAEEMSAHHLPIEPSQDR